MTVSIRVHALTSADLPQVRDWMRASREAPAWSDADLANVVDGHLAGSPRQRRGWAAATGDGELAGFVIATALRIAGAAAECELEFLFVAPHLRRSGVGRGLLQQLIAWGGEIGATELWLEVRASNMAAQRLYAASGFVAVGLRPGYYLDPREDAVLMQRGIADSGHHAPL